VAISMKDGANGYPQIFRVCQKFDAPRIDNVPAEVESQLARLSLGNTIRPGQSVAISAGSRGIANIHLIIKAIADHIKSLDAEPFIVPAMGSHAGGKAEGQQKILESYGITEKFCGCPIRSSMETVIVCRAAEGFPVHFDKYAYDADHVVLCNRIKTHTQFSGDIESGLMKIMLPGLGKHTGAKIYHRAIKDFNFSQILHSVAGEILDKCNIVVGVGVVENSYCQTAKIQAALPQDLEKTDKELLILAKKWAPRLPFDNVDILLIDETGKEISGTGFDVSLVGRKHIDHKAAPDEYPKVRIIALRNLTDKSGGNAEGMGLAEFCLTRFLEKVSVNTTRVNALTSGHYTGSMTPLDYATDREMLDVMLREIGLTEPPDAKLLWIRNTLSLSEVECSVAYLDEARSREDLEILSEPRPLPFDADGFLSDDHMNQNNHCR
jgi:hypothetical protein